MNSINRGFVADLESLATNAKRLEALAERAHMIVAELERGAANPAVVWGNDRLGHSLAAAHDNAAGQLIRRVREVSGRLTHAGSVIRSVAAHYRNADTDATSSIDAVRREGVGTYGR